MRAPFSAPIAAAATSVATMAGTMAKPACTMSLATKISEKAKTDATEISIPPVMITKVMPSAMMPSNTMFIARTSRLALVRTLPNAAWTPNRVSSVTQTSPMY